MAAAIPLERARRLEPDKSSIREALGRAYFRSGALRAGARGVRGRGGALPGQRLRPLLPRPRRSRRQAATSRPAATPRSPPGMRPDRADYRASARTGCLARA